MCNGSHVVNSCPTFSKFNIVSLTVFEIIFHRNNVENVFHFRFGKYKISGFHQISLDKHISWDSILLAGLVKIGGNRGVARGGIGAYAPVVID